MFSPIYSGIFYLYQRRRYTTKKAIQIYIATQRHVESVGVPLYRVGDRGFFIKDETNRDVYTYQAILWASAGVLLPEMLQAVLHSSLSWNQLHVYQTHGRLRAIFLFSERWLYRSHVLCLLLWGWYLMVKTVTNILVNDNYYSVLFKLLQFIRKNSRRFVVKNDAKKNVACSIDHKFRR